MVIGCGMKILLSFILWLVTISAMAQAPILRGPLTTNTPTAGTNLIRSLMSYSGAFYPTVNAVGDAAGNGMQVWQQLYTGDTNAAAFTFKVTVGTNNFNPAVYGTHPYQLLNDVQLHYGYNLGAALPVPSWTRGFESTWFNPPREPQMEIYDRIHLTNWAPGVFRDVAFGYTVELPSGTVTAAIDSDQLIFRNPYAGGGSFMSATANTNGEGILTLNKAYIQFFQNTNAWLIDGFYGNYSNVLFSSGGVYDNITFFKGANAASSDLRLSVGSVSQKSLRYDGTNSNQALQGWTHQLPDGTFQRIAGSPNQQSYTIPNGTAIGGTSGNYRTIGTLTNAVQEYIAGTIQLDLVILSGNSFNENTTQRYVIPLDAYTVSDWDELVPANEASRGAEKNYAVDMRYSGGRREFRLRCIRTSSGNGSFFGVVTTFGHNLWTTDVSGSGTGATVTASYPFLYTPMIQTPYGVGINTNNPHMALQVVGNVYVSGDVSALTFTDRSKAPGSLKDAYEIVQSVKSKGGHVDHDALSPKAWGTRTRQQATGKAVVEPDPTGRDLGMVISAQALVIQDLQKRLAKLEMKASLNKE